MASVDELEAALAASSFDGDPPGPAERELLAVYGDALQAAGDPRGELIAIDLHADAHGGTPELERRREEALTAWLGPLGTAHGMSPRYGFLYVGAHEEETLSGVLASPAARYMTGVFLGGGDDLILGGFRALGAAPRPWMRRLDLHQWSLHENVEEQQRARGMVMQDLVAALIRATPHLRTLTVHGTRVLAAFEHPAVRHIHVTGWDALGSLIDDGPPLAISDLDFAFGSSSGSDEELVPLDPDRLLRPSRLPALRRLDLSSNEPGRGHQLGGQLDVFAFLRGLAITPQLERLRLPSLRSEAQADALQDALDRMPGLAELELRHYGRGCVDRTPRHASAKLTVRALPWPAPDLIDHRDLLTFALGDGGPDIEVDLAFAIERMERWYRHLAPEVLAGWDAIWRAVRELGEGGPGGDRDVEIPAAAVLYALDALDFWTGDDAMRWKRLRQVMREHAGDTVRVYTERM